ncbi:MAG: hypothetical protein KDC92_10230 [Bacteroidetes bacterium]|nr:hypothetical protein [Bacteroidota bacterium]
MKNLCYILLLLALCNCSNAQFFDRNAEWYYSSKGLISADYGEIRRRYINDENFDTFIRVHFEEDYRIIDYTDPEKEDTTAGKRKTYLDIHDSVVYYSKGRVWFNFKLKQGDTISFYRHQKASPDSFYQFKVDTTYYVDGYKNWILSLAKDSVHVLDDMYEKHLELHFQEGVGYVYPSSFIPFYYMSGSIDHNDLRTFECYKNWKTGYTYPNGCNAGYLSAQKPEKVSLNTLYSNGELVVILPDNCKPGYLEIYDLNGRIVYSEPFEPAKRKVFIREVSSTFLVRFSNYDSTLVSKVKAVR